MGYVAGILLTTYAGSEAIKVVQSSEELAKLTKGLLTMLDGKPGLDRLVK